MPPTNAYSSGLARTHAHRHGRTLALPSTWSVSADVYLVTKKLDRFTRYAAQPLSSSMAIMLGVRPSYFDSARPCPRRMRGSFGARAMK